MRDGRAGQATLEYALLYVSVILPLTFGIIFVAQMLWVWHSVVDYTRDGARYAATHCYEGDTGPNVISYMQSKVPLMIDQDQFRLGNAQINVNYFAKDPATGTLSAFACDSACSVDCEPDAVTVGVSNYVFSRLLTFLKLPPITIPTFATSVAVESAGCDPTGNCLP